jgi:hypothetical protein
MNVLVNGGQMEPANAWRLLVRLSVDLLRMVMQVG